MNANELKERTKQFALSIIKLAPSISRKPEANVIRHQIIRSGTSVGANYRAACRARSRAEFISKIGIVEEEADETVYWLELLNESGLAKTDLATTLLQEARELVAIFSASRRTAKSQSSPGANRKLAIGNRQ